MKILISICMGGLITIAVTVQAAGLPKAKLTALVLDEQLKQIAGATVRVSFSGKPTDEDSLTIGTTDTTGQYSCEGYSRICTSADARKDGFYLSGSPFIIFTNVESGHWKPWNPTVKIILRPIGKPVALYAKTVHLEIPVLDKPCGFDLVASDWMAPYGKGKEQDLVFKLNQYYQGIQNYDLRGELTFEKPANGMQETFIPEIGKNSEFKWERLAPETGYQMKFALQNTWTPQGKLTKSFKSQDDWQGYFFRIRTEEKDGKIIHAQYGKIFHGIAVYPNRKSGNPKIVFTYYLNPTSNDRNLEWDTKRNLFSNLSFMETPREP